MTQLLTPQIRQSLRDAADLDPAESGRGMSARRNAAIKTAVDAAKQAHPEMFYTDVMSKTQGWVGKSCATARSDETLCGKDGTLFKAKP